LVLGESQFTVVSGSCGTFELFVLVTTDKRSSS